MSIKRHNYHSQRGAALIIVLVILLVITVLSLSAMRSSTMELRMAGNYESGVSAFQASHALLDALIATPTSTPVVGNPGYRLCTVNEAACDSNQLKPLGDVFTVEIANGEMSAVVTRLAPDLRPPPRGLESSVDKFSAAAFEVQSRFDAADQGRGSATLVEGVLVLVPTN